MSNGEPTGATSYEVVGKLADGDVAELFLAKATGALERLVVVKRIPRKVTQNVELVRSFLDEARLAARLQHPNVAQVFEVGKLGGSYFFSMEFVNGETLRALVEHARSKRIQVPIRSVVTIAAGAAAGLHHAHERKGIDGAPLGTVHADISPTNLLVSRDGIVKLVDFGIAKARGRSHAPVSANKVCYWSPEQARGDAFDRRSDLFSLGIVLWELITLEDLYHRGGDAKTRAALENEPPTAPSTRRYDVPPELDAIVMRLLAKNPADRYQDADELLAALEGLASKLGFQLSTAELARMMRLWFGNIGDPAIPASDKPLVVKSEPVPAELAVASEPVDDLLDTVRSATEVIRAATAAIAGDRGRPTTGTPVVTGDSVAATREDFAQIRDRILEQARKKKETNRPPTQPPPIGDGVVAAVGAGDVSTATRAKRETLTSTSNAYSFITDVSGKAAEPIRKLGITSTPPGGGEASGMTSAAAATEALVKGQAAAAAVATAARVEAARAAAMAKAEEAARADEAARAAAAVLRAEAMARADEKARAAAAKSDTVKSEAAKAAVTTPATGIPAVDASTATGPATAADIITSPTAGPSEPGATKVVVEATSDAAATDSTAEADADAAKAAAAEATADAADAKSAAAETDADAASDAADAKSAEAKTDAADASGAAEAKSAAAKATAETADAKPATTDSDARTSSKSREAPPASAKSAVRSTQPRPALDIDDDRPSRPGWLIPGALAAAALVLVVLVKTMGGSDDKQRASKSTAADTRSSAQITATTGTTTGEQVARIGNGVDNGGAAGANAGSHTTSPIAAGTTAGTDSTAGADTTGSASTATDSTSSSSTAADTPGADKSAAADNTAASDKSAGNTAENDKTAASDKTAGANNSAGADKTASADKAATSAATVADKTATSSASKDRATKSQDSVVATKSKDTTSKTTNAKSTEATTDKSTTAKDAASDTSKSIEDLVAAAEFSKANAACKTNTIFNSTRLTACTLAACNVKDVTLAKRWVRAVEKAARPDLIRSCSSMGVEIGEAPSAQPAAAPAPPPGTEPAPTP